MRPCDTCGQPTARTRAVTVDRCSVNEACCDSCATPAQKGFKDTVVFYLTGANPRPASRAERISHRLAQDGLRVAIAKEQAPNVDEVVHLLSEGYGHIVAPWRREDILDRSFLATINRLWPQVRNTEFRMREKS